MSSGNKNMERVLKMMAEKRASDVFLSANMPVLIKIQGQTLQLTNEPLAPNQPRMLLAEVLTPSQLEELDETGELNVGIQLAGVGMFRLSGFKQRGTLAAVMRYLPSSVPELESLRLPDLLGPMSLAKRGLILLVGATGTGKSTTIAAMVQHRSRQVGGHILTIEDPVEFLFSNAKSVINQREVGRDVQSLQIGLKNAMRQAPDCIFIGEIRDRETMSAALSYALSGHLVLSTLHANNSYHALSRIVSFYPPEARQALLSDLAAGLRASVSQRLPRSIDGPRVPACEVLLNTQFISELIEQGNLSGIKDAMERLLAEGSQTFEQDLARLINEKQISRDEGILHADSPTNLLWRLQNDHTSTKLQPAEAEEDSGPSFTEITLDVIAPKGPPRSRAHAAPAQGAAGNASASTGAATAPPAGAGPTPPSTPVKPKPFMPRNR